VDLAAAGIVLQAFGKIAHPLLSTGFYLAMGWTVLAIVWQLFALLPHSGSRLVAGGRRLSHRWSRFFPDG
jgi:hemolysin III